MTVRRFTSDEAARNLRANRTSRWPDGRASAARLEGYPKVAIAPTFSFSLEDKIMTIGSCFAREIEKVLSEIGFVLPALSVEIPRAERMSETGNDILNKYTVHSMENEIRWAFESIPADPEDFYLGAGDGLWHDGQMSPNLMPAGLERVIERRAIVSRMMAQIAQCRILVMTLGLAEAWFDTKTGIHLNGMPPKVAIAAEPERFRLQVLEYSEILDSLRGIHGLLKRYGHPDFKILLTVSPVPFKATFAGSDALMANTYSKSVQRAAAESFSASYDNVDYFPSYEIVTLANREVAYELDNIHVTRGMVSHIMATVLAAYVPSITAPKADATALKAPTRTLPPNRDDLRAKAKHLMEERQYDEVILVCSSLLFRFGDTMTVAEQAKYRLQIGMAMLRTGLTKEGVRQLTEAETLAPTDARTIYKLGLGLSRLNKVTDAIARFRTARELAPTEPDYAWRLGLELIKNGLVVEGIEHVRAALMIDPGHAHALALSKQYDKHSG